MRTCFNCQGDGFDEIKFECGEGVCEPCYVCEGTVEVEDGCYCSAYCPCECLCDAWQNTECTCQDY